VKAILHSINAGWAHDEGIRRAAETGRSAPTQEDLVWLGEQLHEVGLSDGILLDPQQISDFGAGMRAAAVIEPAKEWNPRYVAYATAHGRDPDAMLLHDREAWPGGSMVGFMCWIQERLGEWRKARGLRRDAAPCGDQQHDDFTACLQRYAETTAPAVPAT